MVKALPVFRHSIGESWRGMIGWTLGITAALSMYLPLYPSIGGNGEMQAIIDSMPPALVNTLGYEDIASGPGYAQATFFGLIGFLLFVIAATGWGSSLIAGAEESGRLEITLAHGVSRVQYALEATLSALVRLAILGIVSGLLVWVYNEPSQLGIDSVNIIAACAALVGLAAVSATLGLLVGAMTGRRSFATAAGAGIAILGYVFNAVANQVPDAHWLRGLSPYAWAYENPPLIDGPAGAGLALLWGVTVVFAAATAAVLQRRDLAN